MLLDHTTLPPIEVRLGARLLALRRRRGLSSAELARAIGISFHRMRRFESGFGRIDAASLWKLSVVLDVSVDDLIGAATRPRAERSLHRSLH